MINVIWFFILSVGIIYGFISGRGEVLSKAIITSTDSTVKLTVSLIGIMCLWCGIMKIAEKSGLTEKIAKLLKPILKLIFKRASNDEKALGAIVMNLTANMMGLSNAATPFGIKAMEELNRLNDKEKGTASDDMVLFLVLNACCIQIIPTTIISIRAAVGSNSPAEIILPTILATGTAAVFGIIFCKILQKYF